MSPENARGFCGRFPPQGGGTAAAARFRARGGVRAVMVLLCLSGWFPRPGRAGAEGGKPLPEAAIPGEAELDPARLGKRIAELEQTATLSDPAKEELASLKQAVTFLGQAADEEKLAKQLEALARDAPDRLRGIEEELARPIDGEVQAPPAGAQLDELTPLYEKNRAALEAARKLKDDVEAEVKTRADRRSRIPEEVAAATKRLEEVKSSLAAEPSSQDPPELRSAKRAQLLAERKRLENLLKRLQQELGSYDARRDLLRARRQQAERGVLVAQRQVDVLEKAVSARRQEAAERAKREAEDAKRRAITAHEAVRLVVDENTELAGELAKISALTGGLRAEKKRIDALKSRWDGAYEKTQQREKKGGLTDAIGIQLRKQRTELPDLREHERQLEDRRKEMNRVQLRRAELDDALLKLVDIQQEAEKRLEQKDLTRADPRWPAVLAATKDALTKQRDEHLKALIEGYDAYFDQTLSVLHDSERDLVDLVRQYRDYIDERILWIQSTQPLGASDLGRTWSALVWLTSPGKWSEALAAVWGNIRALPLPVGGALLLFLALLGGRRRLRAELVAYGKRTDRITTDHFSATVAAAVVTVLLALLWPTLLWAVSWRLGGPDVVDEFPAALAAGLHRAAVVLLALALLRQVCTSEGLGDKHFRWRGANLKLVRRHVRWLVPIVVPLAFLTAATGAQGVEAHHNSLGRLAFIASMGAGAVFLQRVFKPVGGVLHEAIARHPGGWLDRLRYVWYPSLVLAPVALAAAAVAGYFYTATQLEHRLFRTAWFVLGIIVVRALLLRWLALAHRKLALEQARKRLQVQAAADAAKAAPAEGARPAPGGGAGPAPAPAAPPGAGSGATKSAPLDESVLDVTAVSGQTRRLLNTLVGFGVLIGLVVVWAGVFPALGILREVELWSHMAAVTETVTQDGREELQTVQRLVPVTLAELALALFVLAMTVAVTKNIPGLLEITILKQLPFTPGGRYAITMVARYLLATIGVVLAFNAIGIGWSKVQWLIAAIGVGLGFGLQEIFANFVSGLIILLERPIRVGDIVTLGDTMGKVTRIRMRATTIRDWDRRELIVPNKSFITGELINWTLSDPITRVVIPVGIAYGSDTALARELLLRVARESSYVVEKPAPQAIFRSFGDSALVFELRVFLPTRDVWPNLVDELHTKIDNEFRKANIEIAFPQRDVHIRSIRASLPVVTEEDEEPEAPPAE